MCKNKFYKVITTIVLILILWPSRVFALGDPAIVFYAIFILLTQIFMAGFLILSKIFSTGRLVAISIYLLNVITCWMWAFQYRGPEIYGHLGLLIPPTAIFILLIFLFKIRKEVNGKT